MIVSVVMPWDFTLLVLFLAVVVPWRSYVRMRQLMRSPSTTSRERLVLYTTTIISQWLVAGVAFWRASARGFSPRALGLILDRPASALTIAAGLSVLLGVTQFLALRRLAQLPASEQGYVALLARRMMPQNSFEAFSFTALAATVAICEEFLYRGFLLDLGVLLASGPTAATVLRVTGALTTASAAAWMTGVLGSSVLFGLGHLYQGWRGVASTFVLGLVFCALRILTTSLVPGAAVHFTVDLVAGLAAPRLLGRDATAFAAESSPGHQP